MPYTPESRLRVHEHLRAKREKQDKKELVSFWHCYYFYKDKIFDVCCIF